MLATLRLRRFYRLHLTLLLLLGMGVFGTSLANALTDIHMSAHAEQGGDVHHHDDAALAAAADAADDLNSLLHALVHCVDCHGHGGVLPGVAAAWVVAVAPRVDLPAPQAAQRATLPVESPFRPPIAV